MSTDYDTNSSKLRNSLFNIKTDYAFTYFKPDSSQITVADLNLCYAGKPDPSIQMHDINIDLKGPQVYHTNKSCKLNASLLQAKYINTDQQNIFTKTIANGLKKQGLKFVVVDGYSLGNPKYFLNKNSSYSDLATKFDTIANATKNLISDPDYVKYSVEWYGFFCPPVTGNWTFKISSSNNNIGYVWVGDIAINDYANSDYISPIAKTTSSSGGQTSLNMNRYYPIRIQYGNQSKGDIFVLKITGPNGQDGIPYLFNLYNADGTLFEKSVIYYSLIESDPNLTSKGLYNCYVTRPDAETYKQLKNNTSSSIYETVWSLLDEAEARDNNKLNSNNYLAIDKDTGVISLYGSSGILKSLTDYTGNPIKSTGNIKLGDDGLLQVENSEGVYTLVSKSNAGLDTPQPDATNNNMNNTFKITSNLSMTNRTTPFILLSTNKNYMLSITKLGNLAIVQTSKACKPTNSTDSNVHYTSSSTSDPNSRYLYRINGDEKMNNLYMVNKSKETLLPVEKNPTNIVLLQNQYTSYSGYYPSETIDDVKKSQPECQAECDSNPACSYYYAYTSGGTSFCKIHVSTSFGSTLTPPSFAPKQPSNTGESTLYLRNYGMNLSPTDARTAVPNVQSSDYAQYQQYELLADKKFILADSKNIGYNGFDTPLRNQLVRNWNYIKGSGQPLNSPEIESFDTHEYQNSEDVRNLGGNPGNDKNLPDEIINKQIHPMISVAQDYAALQQAIHDKYYSIGSKLDKVSNTNRTGIRDELQDDPNQIYDFNGNTFYYGSKKPQKQDALKEDINIMLTQTNDLFILGSLTIASLLIAAIYFVKE